MQKAGVSQLRHGSICRVFNRTTKGTNNEAHGEQGTKTSITAPLHAPTDK